MFKEAEKYAAADKARKTAVEKANKADSIRADIAKGMSLVFEHCRSTDRFPPSHG